jgi:hypothetical protein
MTDRRWFTANERAAYRRRVALEREATELIRAADRRQGELALSRPVVLTLTKHRQCRGG